MRISISEFSNGNIIKQLKNGTLDTRISVTDNLPPGMAALKSVLRLPIQQEK